MELQDYKMGYFIKKLQEEGITHAKTRNGARQTIERWMNVGKLTLRRNPVSRFYVVNDNEIAEIVKEFRPGGSGEWHFKD